MTRTPKVPVASSVREEVLRRSGGHCERCGMRGSFADLHHRKQRSLGGEDTTANLLHLCRRCHDRVHDLNDYEDGYLLRSWQDPAVEPVRLAGGQARLI